ncbi:MAG: hypothetical protein LBB68_11455 [Treponema sp.]|jgi:hypothetical protein|nr:hypothetical protein [Treponema sp.]
MLWDGAVDTLPYPDGDLPIKIKAVDGTGKETIFEGVYVVKNLPPVIDVQVPSEPDPGKMRELVAGGVMMGVATDPWGVAPGFSLIQFWPADSSAPDPENRSNWNIMDKPDYLGVWKEIANNPGERESLSKKAMEFRYRAVDHTDTSVPPRSLDPGYYRYRFLVMDAAGDIFRYPPAGTEPDYPG